MRARTIFHINGYISSEEKTLKKVSICILWVFMYFYKR